MDSDSPAANIFRLALPQRMLLWQPQWRKDSNTARAVQRETHTISLFPVAFILGWGTQLDGKSFCKLA